MIDIYKKREVEIELCFQETNEIKVFSEDEYKHNSCLNPIVLTANMSEFSEDSWKGWKDQRIQSFPDQFCTVHDDRKKLNLFLRSRDNKILVANEYSNVEWTNWFSPAYPSKEQLSNMENSLFAERFGKDGQTVLFIKGTDGHLWDYWASSATLHNNLWQFRCLPILAGNEYRAIERAYGGLEAFVIGPDNGIWHSWTKDYDNDEWSQWESLGGCAGRGLYLCNNPEGYPELLVIDPLGKLWTIRHYTNGWHNWTCLGNALFQRAVNVMNKEGGISVYAIGFDQKLYRISRGSLNADWGQWECLGGQYTKIAGCHHRKGSFEKISLLGSDHRLYLLKEDGSHKNLGGCFLDVITDSLSEDRYIAIGCDTAGNIYSKEI